MQRQWQQKLSLAILGKTDWEVVPSLVPEKLLQSDTGWSAASSSLLQSPAGVTGFTQAAFDSGED